MTVGEAAQSQSRFDRSDFASRYLTSCEALATTKAMYAFTVFERAFKDFQPGAASRGPQHALPRRALFAFTTPL